MGDSQHVHTKGIFQLGLLIQDVADFLDIRIFFQFQDNADSFFIGLVGNIHHIRQRFILYQFRNVHQEFINAGANHSVRDLTDDQLVPVCFSAA